MNNSLIVGIALSAFVIGGGSVYMYMSSQETRPVEMGNAVNSSQVILLTKQMASLTMKVDQLFEMRDKLTADQAQALMQMKFRLDPVPSKKSPVIVEKSAAEISDCKEAAGTIALVNLATGMGLTSAVAECE